MKITIDTEEKVCFLHNSVDVKLENVVDIIKKINGSYSVEGWSIRPYEEDYSRLVTYPSFPLQPVEPVPYIPNQPYYTTSSRDTGEEEIPDPPGM